jgi:uncharacterized protein (TIGR02246 family)
MMKVLFSILIAMIMTSNSFGQTNANDEAKIKQVLADFTTAWNRHDAKAFSNVFTDDADLTNVRGQSYHGKSEIETHHEPIFATRFKDSFMKIGEIKIRFIKPDVASLDALWEMSGIKDADGNEISEKGLMSFVLTKNNDKWLIQTSHNMPLHENNNEKNKITMKLISTRIITDDVKRLVDFYAKITGLPVVQFTPSFAEFKTDKAALAIGAVETMQFWGGDEVAKAAQNQTVIVEFIVNDVDEIYKNLENFIQPYMVQKPTVLPWGNKSLLLRDPDGNLVNFFTPITPEAIKRFEGTI